MNQKNQPDIQPFDLFLAGNIVHEISSFLTKITDQCGQTYETRLAQMLQNDVEVMTEVEVLKTSLKSNHDKEKYRTWVTVNGNQQYYGAIAIDRQLSSACLDLLCGGKGTPTSNHATREGPVAGERRILAKMIEELFDCFSESMSAIIPFDLAITSKSEDALATRIHRGERDFVVYLCFIISTGEVSGAFELFLPASVLSTTGLGNRKLNKSSMNSALTESLTQVPLPVTAVLGRQNSTLKQILNLKPGEILPLHEPVKADVYVRDKYFCNAAVVSDNSRLMLQIKQESDDTESATDQKQAEKETSEDDASAQENSKNSRSARAEARRKARAKSIPADAKAKTRSPRSDSGKKSKQPTA